MPQWKTGGGRRNTLRQLRITCWIAGGLLWLDPAVMVDGYGWPQWDIWCVPFYIWAAWAASTNRWFATGVLLLIGAMFKAQLMMVAPVLLALWLGAGLLGGPDGAARTAVARRRRNAKKGANRRPFSMQERPSPARERGDRS